MEISLDRLRREGRQLTPHHWLVGHLVVFADSCPAASASLSSSLSANGDKTRVVATVTCRDHFCSSLNNKWLAYASPDGTINVVRDNQVLTATLQRVDPVIRIDYVDNATGAVWFCVQNETWRRWVWAWNHNVKTATQANLIKGPDVTDEYKHRVFTAREELHKTASVYAYRKAPGEYWIHNDQARQTDVRIEFEPTWYDLATSSFMTLENSDSESDEENEKEDEDDASLVSSATKDEESKTRIKEESEEEEASRQDDDEVAEEEEPVQTSPKEEEDDEEQEQRQMVVLPA